MQVRNNTLLYVRFSSNTVPITAQFVVLEVLPVYPSTITDIRFKKADVTFGDVDITSHEIFCFQVDKLNFLSGAQEPRVGDWLIPADDIPDVKAYIQSYNPATGLFGSETLLFDIVPNLNPCKFMRIMSYSFDDYNIFLTCLGAKNLDEASSIYFDGRYTTLNNKIPYTILNRELFQV